MEGGLREAVVTTQSWVTGWCVSVYLDLAGPVTMIFFGIKQAPSSQSPVPGEAVTHEVDA